MPIPSSGPLSLTDIQTEFGGTNPISLNEYYAGGGLVPAGATGTYGAVPSSGTISIQNFYGTANIYPINNSLRFRRSASAYLSRTPSVAGNNQIFTISVWAKRGQLSVDQNIYFGGVGNEATTGYRRTTLKFNNTDTLEFQEVQSNVGAIAVSTTSAVFRDPSAWYHIVAQVDTTQATSTNRVRLYVNGVLQTIGTLTAYSQNYTTQINTTQLQQLGRSGSGTANHLDGYLAEAYMIDGQALSASSFGETNATTGVWQPKQYTGTYGTNGFYLKFSNIALTSGSNTGLGQDFSGNGNFYNTTNISVTAGTTYDAMTDSPTPISPTIGNYCVLNNIALRGTSTPTGSTSNANLTATTSTTTGSGVGGTMAVNMPSGNKYYWEVTLVSGVTAAASACVLGVCENTAADGLIGASFGYDSSDIPTYTNGDTISFAYDGAASILYCYKNNVLAKTITSVSSSSPLIPFIRDNIGTAIVADFNFGQRPFTYTPPTGYVRLNTTNLPTSTIVKGNSYMDATLYTGTGASLSVTNNASFNPSLVWIKSRSAVGSTNVYDAVRGATLELETNVTTAEQSQTLGLTAFNSNGFTLGSQAGVNGSGISYVAWQWLSGSSTVTNTSGSISAQVRANTTTGFSIITYTGIGTAGTVGHGLGVAPKFVIVKTRSAAASWVVWSPALTGSQYLLLNQTDAVGTSSTTWNATVPTSTVFSVGLNDSSTNVNGVTHVAYCWSEIAGFSKIGSYTGNGNADGPFVYTGFRPKFILIRNISATNNWNIFDSTRDPFNVVDLSLQPNLSTAEFTEADLDILSNGFKLRVTNAGLNGNTNTLIYMAFAENPFKNSLAR
jgi:hypothetical protein